MRKYIGNELSEAIVAAHQSGKGFKAFSKVFGPTVKHGGGGAIICAGVAAPGPGHFTVITASA